MCTCSVKKKMCIINTTNICIFRKKKNRFVDLFVLKTLYKASLCTYTKNGFLSEYLRIFGNRGIEMVDILIRFDNNLIFFFGTDQNVPPFPRKNSRIKFQFSSV